MDLFSCTEHVNYTSYTPLLYHARDFTIAV